MRARAIAALILPALGARALASPPTPWSEATAPAPGPARSIGGYSAGCIAGAVQLPATGRGFRVAKPERRRWFGHPLLVDLIQGVGRALAAAKLAPLAVGDLGQPRGGPAPTGHASHQTGLDVDVWFVAAGAKAASMVAGLAPAKRFGARQARLVELFAADPRVDRIFVHPVLKRALCERAGAARDWLRKVRPWWGHDDHFHVRLACPPDSPDCTAQPALALGDGCDALGWWFSPHASVDRERERSSYKARVGAAPPLPPGCDAVIAAP
jgi:penicillin-insensitive murein endopeptidase